jgi:membrane-associated protein
MTSPCSSPWARDHLIGVRNNAKVLNAILDLLHGAVTSPWVFPTLVLVAMADGVLPVLPAETLTITAGMYAASGRPNLIGVALCAALGALAGDHLSYVIGRASGDRLIRRMPPGTRRRASFDWAGRSLEQRGGLILMIARYIAGGRNAATLTMGAVRYPLRKFTLFDAIGAVSWGFFSALLGYLGGVTFENSPLKGLALAIGLAVALTGLTETARRLRRHPAAAGAGAGPDVPSSSPAAAGRDRGDPV